MSSAGTSPKAQLFPSKSSFLIFCSYITLFVSQGLLVIAVQKRQIPGFSSLIVVLLTELVKLIICVTIYVTKTQSGFAALIYDLKSHSRLFLLYSIPAFLYCLYNNLTFINLELFDVSTYYCLMQFRIVLTAIIYQILFRRQLNIIQWFSLIILTIGCLIKQYDLYNNLSRDGYGNEQTTLSLNQQVSGNHEINVTLTENQDRTSTALIVFLWSTTLLLFQMFCSCFAGVYNEYLLKDSVTARSADVILQNIFMYLDSIICNLVAYYVASIYSKLDKKGDDSTERLANLGIFEILYNITTNPIALVLVLNNAFSGLVASFFLKSLNSIVKTFASALELFAVTALAWLLFNDRVDLHTLVALTIVAVALFIYSRNPVSVAPPTRNQDGFMLLPTTEDQD